MTTPTTPAPPQAAAAPMSWDAYVAGWSSTHDGFDPRHAGPLLRRWLRIAFTVGGVLARFGLRPSYPMVIAAGCAVLVPLLAARGGAWPALAALVLLLGVAADTVGQTLAVLLHRSTRLGGFYRAMLDRMSEMCWLAALAVLGAQPTVVLLCVALVWLHEYVRARAGAVGMRAAGSATIGDHGTRIWLTLLSLLLAAAATTQVGADLAAGVVTMMMVLWLTLAVLGLGQLMGIVRKVLM
ncbi:CDP-alcohol phosphatidyltransferase family protein [Catellatospora tritici]|uniref:CDP-alcohol phosphatidyltransferase family protein n=1 Tax=Catellatospora tritici TaxID=2851566 RepID=UPI001C2D27E0|nr:CDP-alcohol phosphatidyltransferase family protein [Catellatospora tritici]MBV1852493.1 CDP-alcohol phosphatidyltransferase family protein [Catellatospora tritici]